MTDRMTLSEAGIGVMEQLRHGDWEVVPLNGDATRLLICDVTTRGAESQWVLTIEPVTLAIGLDPTPHEPPVEPPPVCSHPSCSLPAGHTGDHEEIPF